MPSVWPIARKTHPLHYCGVIMGAMASIITSLTIVYSIVYSDADQRKYESSTTLAFVRGIHRWTVNSPHKRPVTRKMFPFDDVIMIRDPMAAITVYNSSLIAWYVLFFYLFWYCRFIISCIYFLTKTSCHCQKSLVVVFGYIYGRRENGHREELNIFL